MSDAACKAIREYLGFTKNMSCGGHGEISRRLVQYGKQFHVVDLREELKLMPIRQGEMKQCFMNAYKLSDQYRTLVYCEGYAVPKNIHLPILHAWVVTPCGHVIDNTWREAGAAYYGIPFRQAFVRETILTTEEYGVLFTRPFLDAQPEDYLSVL